MKPGEPEPHAGYHQQCVARRILRRERRRHEHVELLEELRQRRTRRRPIGTARRSEPAAAARLRRARTAWPRAMPHIHQVSARGDDTEDDWRCPSLERRDDRGDVERRPNATQQSAAAADESRSGGKSASHWRCRRASYCAGALRDALRAEMQRPATLPAAFPFPLPVPVPAYGLRSPAPCTAAPNGIGASNGSSG